MTRSISPSTCGGGGGPFFDSLLNVIVASPETLINAKGVLMPFLLGISIYMRSASTEIASVLRSNLEVRRDERSSEHGWRWATTQTKVSHDVIEVTGFIRGSISFGDRDQFRHGLHMPTRRAEPAGVQTKSGRPTYAPTSLRSRRLPVTSADQARRLCEKYSGRTASCFHFQALNGSRASASSFQFCDWFSFRWCDIMRSMRRGTRPTALLR